MGKKTLKDFIQIAVSLGLGIFIFWYAYKDQDIDSMIQHLQGANYFWIFFPLLIAVLSHFIRAVRWKMLIDSLGKKTNLWNVYGAVMAGYFINYLFPRAGEVARCGLLKKYEGISFAELLGTVIIERSIDIIVELIVIFLAIVLQYHFIMQFLQNMDVTSGIYSILTNYYLWAILITSIVIIFLLRNIIKKLFFYGKIKEMLSKVANGLKSILKMKNKGLFILYSLLIFVCYYFMFYLCFYAFDFTENLTMLCALSAFIMGSLGIIAPVQGGLGAWHFMVIQTLLLYGVNEGEAASFAILVHGSQTIMLMSFGAIALVLLPIFNKGEKQTTKTK